jgi:DNA-binding response OmpR family regulator
MRVLLIEDDVMVRTMLSDALSEEGVEVDGLSNAEDALILLGAGQVPDVLVSDVNLGAGSAASTSPTSRASATRTWR